MFQSSARADILQLISSQISCLALKLDYMAYSLGLDLVPVTPGDSMKFEATHIRSSHRDNAAHQQVTESCQSAAGLSQEELDMISKDNEDERESGAQDVNSPCPEGNMCDLPKAADGAPSVPSLQVLEELVADCLSAQFQEMRDRMDAGVKSMTVKALQEGRSVDAIRNQFVQIVAPTVCKSIADLTAKIESTWPGSSDMVDVEDAAKQRLAS